MLWRNTKFSFLAISNKRIYKDVTKLGTRTRGHGKAKALDLGDVVTRGHDKQTTLDFRAEFEKYNFRSSRGG